MKINHLLFLLSVTVSFIFLSCSSKPKADLILLNGKVVTVDSSFSICEAVAVKDKKIIFTGDSKRAKLFACSNTKIIKLNGKLVLPGLIDAHAHMHSLGTKIFYLDISGATDFQQIVDKVAERVKSAYPGEWIVGGRWDQNKWAKKEFPVHHTLSAVSPDNPVCLSRVDGNSAFVNKKALDVAGITRDTPDPEGGKIVKDEKGEPTGVLVNRAMYLVRDLIPEDSDSLTRVKYIQAMDTCLKYGLTGVHEAGVGPDKIALYKELIDAGQFRMRIYAMLGEQKKPILDTNLVEYYKNNRLEEYGGHLLSVRSIKLFFDGALGSRGAAFFGPYEDDHGNTGLLRIPKEYITKVAKAALETGYGVNTHCIGIRGNSVCLDAYAEALKEFPDVDHRFRIEHAQIVKPEDIERFVSLKVIPSMQPTHCTSDMGFVKDRVGEERAKGAYAWRSFIDAGAIIPCGSDFAVEDVNPLLGIYAAVTRQDTKGMPEDGWFPEQRMTIEEAIKGFTIWAAYAAFMEDVIGSIEVGKYADFTILDKDILTIEPKEIITTKVLYTILGGKIMYQTP